MLKTIVVGNGGVCIVFVERWWINLGGGRLPEIRAAAVGQAHVLWHVRRPLLLPAVRCMHQRRAPHLG